MRLLTYLGSDSSLAVSSLQASKVHVVESVTLCSGEAELLALQHSLTVSQAHTLFAHTDNNTILSAKPMLRQ